MTNYLIEQSDETVFKNPKYEKPDSFQLRSAVKAIIKKGDKFGFVTNDASGLIMFAGGGAKSKNLEKEIVRECREETGWKVKVLGEMGKTKALNYKKARELETTLFVVEAILQEEEDLREEDEREINMHVVFLDPQRALHRMSLQNDASKKGVYDAFYHSSFHVQRDYIIFKKYLEDNNLI